MTIPFTDPVLSYNPITCIAVLTKTDSIELVVRVANLNTKKS